MIRVDLDRHTLTFDGEVVEVFRQDGDNYRYHVRFIAIIEVQLDRKGKGRFRLDMEGGGGMTGPSIPLEKIGEVEAFVAEVRQAMTVAS